MGTMKKLMLTNLVFLFLFLCLSSVVFAQDQTTNYSGDLWTRSTLTGDWGGVRNDWAAKGITFDMNLTQIGQGNVGGGKNIDWEYGGRGNLTLHMDTQKMGLWPGGFIKVEVEGNFGNSVNLSSGALMPVNNSQIYPMPGSDQLNLPEVSVAQFFSHYAGVIIGKMDTTGGSANEFAHGKGDTQFFNLALNINPVAIVTVPYSTLGAGLIVLPTKDPNDALITLMAISSDGRANSSGFDTLFKGNTTYVISGRVRTDFFGLTGHQFAGAAYSTKNFSSLDQSLRFFIENRTIEQKDNSWFFFYNFDQYLYEPKKGQGIGIFGRFGASDGNPNPFHYFYSLGVGGKGIVPGRPLDQFGLGWYYIDISNPKFTGPLETRELLRDEQGFEAYYNFAVTPWLKLTPDIQVIRPGQKDKVSVVSALPPVINREGIDTATIIGLRLQIIF